MASLQVLKSQLDELEEQIKAQQSACFDYHRDDQGNLKLYFKNGNTIDLPPFPFRPYQLEVQKELFINGIKRFFLVRPRRAGKEVESWNILVQAAIVTPGLYLMIYPTNVRARMVLWNGAIVTPSGGSLRFLDMIPKQFIINLNQQDMTIKLSNGSIIQILGSDVDPDKLRGINVRGAVFAEYAFADPRVLHILMPVFRQNGGWFILQTTFNGMNHAYRYMQEIKDNPSWYTRVDSVETLVDENGNRYVTEEMIEEERAAGMPEFLIQQEYYSVVQLNQESVYFAREVNFLYQENRIISELLLPNKIIYNFYDIGVNDQTAVTQVQFDHNMKPNIVNYFENKNKALQYYLDVSDAFAAKHGLRVESHFVPHDGKNKNAATLKSYADHGRELGKYFYVVEKPSSKVAAIQSMRQMLYSCKFNKENTTRLIECLSNYSKEYDEKNDIYKDNPKHNWTSHGVDSFQTMTLAIERNMITDKPYDVVYYN